jgi:hypothetical protein
MTRKPWTLPSATEARRRGTHADHFGWPAAARARERIDFVTLWMSSIAAGARDV